MSDERSETAPSCKRKRSVGNSGRCVKQRAKKGYGKKRKCYKYVKKPCRDSKPKRKYIGVDIHKVWSLLLPSPMFRISLMVIRLKILRVVIV